MAALCDLSQSSTHAHTRTQQQTNQQTKQSEQAAISVPHLAASVKDVTLHIASHRFPAVVVTFPRASWKKRQRTNCEGMTATETDVQRLVESGDSAAVDLERVDAIVRACAGDESAALQCAKKAFALIPSSTGRHARMLLCLALLDELVGVSEHVRAFCSAKRVLQQLERLADLADRAHKVAVHVQPPALRPDSIAMCAMRCIRRWAEAYGSQMPLYTAAVAHWDALGVPLPSAERVVAVCAREGAGYASAGSVDVFTASEAAALRARVHVSGLTREAEYLLMRAHRVVETMQSARWALLDRSEQLHARSEALELRRRLGDAVQASLTEAGRVEGLAVVEAGTSAAEREQIVRAVLEAQDAVDAALAAASLSSSQPEQQASAPPAPIPQASAPPAPAPYFDGEASTLCAGKSLYPPLD